METKGRLIAGSHNRNEFVLINADEIARVSVTWISSSSSSSSSAAAFFFNCFADLNTEYGKLCFFWYFKWLYDSISAFRTHHLPIFTTF